MDEPDLNAAYALETPDDNRRLYADWADTYDETFAQQMDYQMPRIVADALKAERSGPAHVLDVGAGTGLVAQALGETMFTIDGLDISAAMLAVAREKGLYAKLIEADLTLPLDLPAATYDAIVSAGTFTHGHVGPDALDGLLRLAKPGAVFVLGVNAEHFEARGFETKFATLAGQITDLRFQARDIYGADADDDHAADQAKIAIFRKA